MEETNSMDTKKSMMMPLVIGLAVLILVAGGAYYFLSNNQNSMPADNSSMQETSNVSENDVMPEVTTTDAMMSDVKTFEVVGSAFKFDVTEIRVKKGDTVRIVFTSGQGTHDWVIDEFNARTKILESNESESIDFVADTAGTFEYYCSVGNHRAMGMVGKLIVEE